MPRGGSRPGTGGKRAGAGRKPGARLTPEETRAALAELAGGDTPEHRAALADRLGMRSATMLRTVLRTGATVAQVEGWRGRLGGGVVSDASPFPTRRV